MDKKHSLIIRYSIGIVFLVSGIILNIFNIGMTNSLGYGTVGNWLIACSVIVFVIATLRNVRKRVVDERMAFLSSKAQGYSFIAFIVGAFTIMIIDAIKPMNISIHMLMSYVLCGYIFTHLIIYQILMRR